MSIPETALSEADNVITLNLPPAPAATPTEAPGPFESAIETVDRHVLVHVRFFPDGTVWEIAETPAGLSKEDWFKRLCQRAGDVFSTRMGSRGFFKLTTQRLEALKTLQAH